MALPRRTTRRRPAPPTGLAFDPGDAAFNRRNAIYLAHAADVAYHRRPAAAAERRLGLDAAGFLGRVTRTRGFLGVCATHAVLAFRGTDPLTLPNWVTDAVVRLVEHEHGGRVHHGFDAALGRAWGRVEALLERADGLPLFLTGHSMGGALAVLTAGRLTAAGRPPVATYTFGSPRVGDPAFCLGYRPATYRVVNRLDLVPELPLASVAAMLPKRPRLTNEKVLGRLHALAGRVPCYGHVNTLVYIDRDGTITVGGGIGPWTPHAVRRAVATRGRSFLEGVTDHLIGSYIRGLEGTPGKRQTGNRRTIS